MRIPGTDLDDLVLRKTTALPSNLEPTEKIQAITDELDRRTRPITRDRDILWCKALLATLDMRDVEKVLKCFNESRDD